MRHYVMKLLEIETNNYAIGTQYNALTYLISECRQNLHTLTSTPIS